MARKHKPLPLLENITIEAVAAEGKCITRVDEQVIFDLSVCQEMLSTCR